ncbi:glycoside hydrolase family 9 protein [Demequina aurantiaca]|uniref:glycoside hydrolase family 9 protein n=1 Tax=Demequina aurantiaca TaxID=676200 RepID=UPI000A7F6F13|nr:glycoside hydrolase family 9 protein [Demequina aurantiaca]
MFTKKSTRTTLAALGAAAILLTSGATAANADVINGDFEGDNTDAWFSYGFVGGSTTFEGGQFCGTVPGGTTNAYDIGFGQNDLDLPAGDYVFSFDVSGEGPIRAIVAQNGGAYATYAESLPPQSTDMTHYDVGFTLSDAAVDPQVAFQVGGAAEEWTFCADNVSVAAPGAEFVPDGGFDAGLGSWFTPDNAGAIIDGALCTPVTGQAGGGDPWSRIVGLNDLTLPAGDYVFSYDVSGGKPVRAIVGMAAAPYDVYAEANTTPGDALESNQVGFSLDEETTGVQVAFQIGTSTEDWTFCVDNVSVLGGAALPQYEPETGPRVRVNQAGYITNAPKRATLVTDSADAVAWELHSAADAVVASGDTSPHGVDASAGLNVHTIDFSSVTAPGTYTLSADGDTSYEFEIGTDAYETLRTDSLNYFYLARSGTEIDGDIVGEDYARAAGHVSSAGGSDTNQGDNNVACQPAEDSAAIYGEPWTCDYTLDVVGGWYDAGDHGKYVVNGGIATAQLLSTYERTKNAPTADAAALGDDTLALPETNNGVPDVLDEAKWELDFMMSMMVPQGEELAGMVHHKVHDYGWTGLPLLPANDAQTRYLHRPSTAATLNLAATAAQGARLFAPYDAEYSQQLLESATTAWNAALAHPEIYAPVADGNNGGGAYDDDDVTDEFYWAAAELYITTGDKEFKDYLLASDLSTENVFDVGGFNWGSVAALGRMDLATVPNSLPGHEAIVASVLDGADAIRAVQQAQPFGQALGADNFVWGSNSQVLNNMVVLGTAYDLSGEAKYRDAAVESADYLLGRNALNNSYVTGYGDVYSENQHSRWFSAQLSPSLPHPPAGSVSGGPNADVGTWDPTFAALYPDQDCAPQFCYVDEIQSWATNEITVNWNSALSWVASFLADQSEGAAATVAPCEVEYITHGTWPGATNNQVWIKNTGSASIDGWDLTWAYPADDEVTSQAWSANYSQSGATVTASSLSWNAKLKPGAKTTIGFITSTHTLADAQPTQFWLNGEPCSTVGKSDAKKTKDAKVTKDKSSKK